MLLRYASEYEAPSAGRQATDRRPNLRVRKPTQKGRWIAACSCDEAPAWLSLFALTGGATLKKDLINRRSWPTKGEARVAIFEWIEVFYNRQRIHTTLGGYGPEKFETCGSRE